MESIRQAMKPFSVKDLVGLLMNRSDVQVSMNDDYSCNNKGYPCLVKGQVSASFDSKCWYVLKRFFRILVF